MAEKKTHQFGISSLSYPWAVGMAKGPRLKRRLSAFELLEKARELGVGLVQIANNLPLENMPWESMVKLKRMASEYDISLEVGTAGTDMEHLLKFLEIARFLKSPILRTGPSQTETHLDITEVEKRIRLVIPEFEKAGVVVVLENQESYSAGELVKLIENVAHPTLRICLDLSRALGAMEGPEEVLGKLGPLCGNFLFRDVVVNRSKALLGYTVEGRPAGKGNIPVKWALDQLRGFGIVHTTIIELWPPWQGDIDTTVRMENEWVAESVEFMRNLC